MEPRETVRLRNEKDGEWQNVLPKRKKKPQADGGNVKEVPNQAEVRPQRKNTAANQKTNNRIERQSEAVIIKPTEGNTYAEVLKNIRSNLNLKESGVKVKEIRKTRAGAILLELEKRQTTKAIFCEAFKTTLRESEMVADLKPKTKRRFRTLTETSR